MGYYRRRALAVLVALAGGVLGAGLGVAPAAAESKLTVDAGYAGNFVPGSSVPVRVVVESDRLIRGTLQVGIKVPGDDMPPVSTPIEVSGGSNKTVTVVLPTPVGRDDLEISVAIQGERLVGETEVRFSGETDLVGLLPDLVDRMPEPLELGAEMGQAVFSELDSGLLATPGALEPLGTIVAPAEGLQALNEQARRNVLTWLDRGGRLAVDAAPGEDIAGLPDAWQPGAAGRVAAGRGQVVVTDGAAAAARWADVVVPTALAAPGDFGMSWWSMEDVATSVGRDGGLRVPSVGWLALFLVGYVVLVGPVVFFVLRRLRRTSWTWLAVAGCAAVFAAGAFVVGADLRSGNEASHGTIVHTSPAGATGYSYVGLVSRSGEDGRAVFPEGWGASSLSSNLGADMGFPGGDNPFSIDPARVSLSPTQTVGEVDLDPGGVGMVVGWGQMEETPGLEVTATARPDGTVGGVLRNTTDETLREVLVVVDGEAWGGGRLAPGEETEWRIDPDDEDWDDGPPEGPWEEAIGWDDGEPSDDSPVNYAMWEEMTARYADPYPSGVAVAAGWSRRYVPPIDVGGEIEAGRTVFTSEAPVLPAEPGQVPAAAVRREMLRTPRSVEIDEDRFEDVQNNWGDVGGLVMRFTLPPGAADVPLRATLPSYILSAQVWDGQAWVPLERIDRQGDLVDESEAEDEDFDPWGDPPTTADLAPEHVIGGAVILRLQAVDVGGGVGLPTVGQVP